MIKSEARKEYNKISNLLMLIILPVGLYLVLYLFNRNTTLSYKEFKNITFTYCIFISIILLIKSASNYIYEVSHGTIKLLVKIKHNRINIILSKMFIILLIFIILMLNILMFSIMFSLINGNIITNIYYYIGDFIINCIPLLFIVYLSFFLSILTSSITFSIISSTLLLVMGGTLFENILKLKITIVKYTFLPYLDFIVLRNKEYLDYILGTYNVKLNINIAVVVLTIYIGILFIISCLYFKKKNIN
ncbi:MAG: ABC transporter permease [Bacilli bacterium]